MARQFWTAALLCLCLSMPVFADDGDLDPGFWADGMLSISSNVDFNFAGMASDPQGQLAVLYSYMPVGAVKALTAWRSVGDSVVGDPCIIDLDLIDPPSSTVVDDAYARDIAFDAYGRLLVLMRIDSDAFDTAHFVYAYDFPSCQLVASYGDGGLAQVLSWNNLDPSYCGRLRPLADGKTMCVGSYYDDLNLGVLVQAIQVNGSLGQGYYAPAGTFASNPSGVDAVVEANGHVVAAAATSFGQRDFFVVDFAADGTVAGAVTVPFDLGAENNDDAKSIAATADGRIVVVGSAQLSGLFVMTEHAVAVLHRNTQGSLVLDPSFSGDGKLTFDFSGWSWNGLEDVAAQGDGKVVVAGASKQIGADYAMLVARLLPDGSFDPDFYPAGSGVRTVEFDVGSPYDDHAYRVALQNGRVVLGGSVDGAGGIATVGVARLLNSYVFGDGFEGPQAPGWLWVE